MASAAWHGASLPVGDNRSVKVDSLSRRLAAEGEQLGRHVAARYRRLIGAEADGVQASVCERREARERRERDSPQPCGRLQSNCSF